jgi:hypothetical protein
MSRIVLFRPGGRKPLRGHGGQEPGACATSGSSRGRPPPEKICARRLLSTPSVPEPPPSQLPHAEPPLPGRSAPLLRGKSPETPAVPLAGWPAPARQGEESARRLARRARARCPRRARCLLCGPPARLRRARCTPALVRRDDTSGALGFRRAARAPMLLVDTVMRCAARPRGGRRTEWGLVSAHGPIFSSRAVLRGRRDPPAVSRQW